MVANKRSNPHYGKDQLFVGAICYMRPTCKRVQCDCDMHEPNVVKIRNVEVSPDSYIRYGVTFLAHEQEESDSDGFVLGTWCYTFPCDLRLKKLGENQMSQYEYEVGQRAMFVGSYPIYDGLPFVCEYGSIGEVECVDEGLEPRQITVRFFDTKRAFGLHDDELIPLADETLESTLTQS